MLEGGSGSPNASSSTSTHDEVFKPKKKKKINNNNNNNRRFSDEQINSLESLFKRENKLEPRKKLEMARELGLHPRQVAIWFQNRRARWKSKQVEQDYTTLKADYHSLNDRFESLKKEKHALLQQLRNLCSQLKEEEVRTYKDLESGFEDGELNINSDGIHDMGDDPLKLKVKHTLSFSQKENMNTEETTIHDERLMSNSFDLGSLFDQASNTCSNWWDSLN